MNGNVKTNRLVFVKNHNIFIEFCIDSSFLYHSKFRLMKFTSHAGNTCCLWSLHCTIYGS